MVKEELIARSPLRVFETSIHGGLGKGNLGVLTSRKGVGKTACLVHIATDKLLRDHHVIHVSFSQNVDHVLSWYEDIFEEISRIKHLEHARDVHDEIVRNRVIMNFSQKDVAIDQIISSLRAMIVDGGFKADAVMFDGYRLSDDNCEDLGRIRDFAQEMDLEVWFSVSALSEDVPYDEFGVSAPVKELCYYIDVLIGLTFVDDHVALTLVKDQGEEVQKHMSLKLDPKSLLIMREDEPLQT